MDSVLAGDVVGIVGSTVVLVRGGEGVDGGGRAACGGEAWGNECSEVAFASSVAKLEEHGRVGGVFNGTAVRAIERQVAFVAGAGDWTKAGEADD